MAKGKRIVLFDYLRGAACIMVLLYHYTVRYQEIFGTVGTWSFAVPAGYMGVAAFFMLSGFLSVSQNTQTSTLGNAAVKRISRLYPTYWVAVILTYAVTALFLPERGVSPVSALINLTMLQSFIGVSPVDGAYWTLANELLFYGLVIVFAAGLKRKKYLPKVFVVWMLILLALTQVQSTSVVFALIGKLTIRNYGHMFIAGSAVYYLVNDRAERPLAVILLVLCIVYQFAVHTLSYFVMFLLFLLIVLLGEYIHIRGYEIPKWLAWLLTPLQWVAQISYPLYLVHQNIGYAILEGIKSLGWIENQLWILLPSAVVVTLAVLLHKTVEKPVGKWLLNAIQR